MPPVKPYLGYRTLLNPVFRSTAPETPDSSRRSRGRTRPLIPATAWQEWGSSHIQPKTSVKDLDLALIQWARWDNSHEVSVTRCMVDGGDLNSKKVVLRTLVFLGVCPVILAFGGPLTKTASPLVGVLAVGTITSFFTFLLTLLFVRWDGLNLRDVGTGMSTQTVLRLVFGFVVGIALVALQDLIIYAGGHTHWVPIHPHQSCGMILLAFVGYLTLALREELAFRGYPLRRLESVWGMWGALLLVGVVFTLEHTAGGWTWSRSLLGPPAGALLFGMAALASRGIAVPLGIHAAFNFGQWLMGQKEISGPWQPVIDAGFTDQAEILGYTAYLVGTLLAASGFWLWSRNRTRSHVL
jgi:membrane protease YdiL (CAAX protease family)